MASEKPILPIGTGLARALWALFLFIGIQPGYSQFEVGIGHVQNGTYFHTEYILLENGIRLTTVQDDPRQNILISYHFNKKNKLSTSVDFYYSKKYQSMLVGKIDPLFGFISKRSFIASGTFQFFVNLNFKTGFPALRRFSIIAGAGPAFYFNNDPYREDFIDDPELNEPFYQSQRIHKNFSLNYSIRLLYHLSKRMGASIMTQGNMTPINRPLVISGDEYNTRTRWRNLGLVLSYRFDIK